MTAGTRELKDRNEQVLIDAVNDNTADRAACDSVQAAINQETIDILESISDAFFSLDGEGRFVYINRKAVELFSYTQSVLGKSIKDYIGLSFWDSFPKYREAPVYDVFIKVMATQLPAHLEAKLLYGQKDVEAHIYPLKQGVSVFLRDISGRKQMENKLKTFLKAFHNSSSAQAIIRQENNKFIDINKAFEDMTGYSREEAIGFSPLALNIWLADKEEQTTLMENFILQGSAANAEIKIRTKDGRTKIALMAADIIENDGEKFILTVAQDITQLRNMEEEIRRLDRLNSIAEMAATISHEVRNPMTTVRGFLQLLKGKPHNKEDRDVFQLMIDELDRATELLSVYLNLSKRSDPINKKMRNLNKVINDLFPLLLSDAIKSNKNILLNQQPVPDLKLNKKEIHQLILNLVRNGLEAMSPGGKLVISTYPDGHGEVILSVKDEGCGIPPAVLEKIGNPFVSGKENGTGMGLAVCYGIAARNNAKIQVETGPAGTEFRIRFKTQDDGHQSTLFKQG